VTVPEPVPDPVTVTHEAFDDEDQLQPAPAVTVIVPVPPVACTPMSVGEAVIEHVVPDSLTVYDLPAIVSVAVLAVVPTFAATV